MNLQVCDCRLSQLATLWSVVCQAHHGPEDAMRSARQRLLELVAEVVEDNDQPFQTIRQKRRRGSRA